MADSTNKTEWMGFWLELRDEHYDRPKECDASEDKRQPHYPSRYINTSQARLHLHVNQVGLWSKSKAAMVSSKHLNIIQLAKGTDHPGAASPFPFSKRDALSVGATDG